MCGTHAHTYILFNRGLLGFSFSFKTFMGLHICFKLHGFGNSILLHENLWLVFTFYDSIVDYGHFDLLVLTTRLDTFDIEWVLCGLH